MATVILSNRPLEFPFLNTSQITIPHNLGYRPQVWIIIGGETVYGDISHTDENQIVVSFLNAKTGTIYLR